MNKRQIIIDCDPGHDDALAIMWALTNDKLEILGITTVAGNQTIGKVTHNVLRLLTLLNKTEIPVAKGFPNPIVRNLHIGGQEVHGESGLEGPEFPQPSFDVVEKNAVEFIIQTLESAKHPITLVPLGPLTNIALVIKMRPDLMEKIECISLMGGGTYGNYTAAAEYNIWADGEAAKVVFDSKLPIIMSGLDVTQKAYITKEENELLRQQNNQGSVLAAELIDYFIQFHLEVEEFPGCTLHDPTAIAALIYPDLFNSIQCNVTVETKGELTYGMTLVDKLDYANKVFKEVKPKNTTFLTDVNRQQYVERFIKDMSKLGV